MASLGKFRRTGIAALLLSFAVGAPADGLAADIAPHQAIYRLKFSSASPTSRFNGLEGAAVSVIERTCEGWAVNEQIVMTMLTTVGGAIDREMKFKATETFDGREFRFHSTSVTNGDAEEFKGNARRSEDGAVEAEFITPRPFEMPLPKGTLFYIGTTQWLVDLAKSGKKTGQSIAFDGTDDEGAEKVTAFVLPDRGPEPGLKGDPALLDVKAWEVRLAFFKLGTQASNPEFEISMRLLENGIVTRFTLIFDDLVVDQLLDDVLPAKDERCG